MFFKVQVRVTFPKRDTVSLNGTNMYLFEVDEVQVSSEGYNDCNSVASRPTPTSTNLAHYF